MRYNCFGVTRYQGEFNKIIYADNDNDAMHFFERWLVRYKKVRHRNLIAIAGVPENNPLFYEVSEFRDVELRLKISR